MGLSPLPRLLVACLAGAFSHIAVTNGQCYYPGGDLAKYQSPCDRYAYASLCCPTGWTCFSNKLCIATDPSVVSSDLPLGTAFRGTCTNPRWNDTACGDFCLNDPVSSNSGSVVPCGNNKWCCQPDSADGRCNCGTGAGTFQVSDGTAQTIIGVVGLQHTSTGPVVVPSSAAPSSSVTATVSIVSTVSMVSTVSVISSPSPAASTNSRSTSSSMTGLPTSASSSKSLSTAISSAASTASTTSLASTTTTGSASAANQTAQQSQDSSSVPVTQTTAFKAGVGAIAGVAFVIVICLIVWFVVVRRQRRRTGDAPYRDNSNGGNWQNPMTSTVPFQIPPSPHPYGDAQSVTSASRAALAEQVAHNRATPRPYQLNEENNPYADRYMAGGAGR